MLQSMGQGEYHHRQLAVCRSHCRGIKPGSEMESWYRASKYFRFLEVLQVPSQVGAAASQELQCL